MCVCSFQAIMLRYIQCLMGLRVKTHLTFSDCMHVCMRIICMQLALVFWIDGGFYNWLSTLGERDGLNLSHREDIEERKEERVWSRQVGHMGG